VGEQQITSQSNKTSGRNIKFTCPTIDQNGHQRFRKKGKRVLTDKTNVFSIHRGNNIQMPVGEVRVQQHGFSLPQLVTRRLKAAAMLPLI